MKKLSILLGTLIIGASFMTSCKEDPSPSDNIKTDPVEGEHLSVKLNGTEVKGGSVTVSPVSDTAAKILISNVVNGYPALSIPVSMEYTGSDFRYSASVELPAPSVETRSENGPGVFDLAISGTIAGDGSTVSADITMALTDYGRGDMQTGAYTLSKEVYDANYSMSAFTPVFLEWKVIDRENCPGSPDPDNNLYLGTAVRLLGSHIISEVLEGVDFKISGNLSATYFGGLIPTATGDDGSVVPMPATPENIQNWLMGKFFAGGTINPYTREWQKSPANLVTWYADKEFIYILPDVKAIVNSAIEAGGNPETAEQVLDVIASLNTMTDQELQSMISSLGALLPEGSDIDLSSISPATVREILGWFVTGVPLKYEYTGDYLQLYADKKMADAFMPVVLAVGGPVIEDIIAKMAAENPMMGLILPVMLQVEHITDLLPVWEKNTESFRVGITLQKESSRSAAKPRRNDIKAPMGSGLETFLNSLLERK